MPKHGGLAVILSPGGHPRDGENGHDDHAPDEETEQGEVDAAHALLDAFHAKDPKALREALCDFIDLHESHERPEEEEENGEEDGHPLDGEDGY